MVSNSDSTIVNLLFLHFFSTYREYSQSRGEPQRILYPFLLGCLDAQCRSIKDKHHQQVTAGIMDFHLQPQQQQQLQEDQLHY